MYRLRSVLKRVYHQTHRSMFLKWKSSQGAKNTIFVNRFNCGGHADILLHQRTEKHPKETSKSVCPLSFSHSYLPLRMPAQKPYQSVCPRRLSPATRFTSYSMRDCEKDSLTGASRGSPWRRMFVSGETDLVKKPVLVGRLITRGFSCPWFQSSPVLLLRRISASTPGTFHQISLYELMDQARNQRLIGQTPHSSLPLNTGQIMF